MKQFTQQYQEYITVEVFYTYMVLTSDEITYDSARMASSVSTAEFNQPAISPIDPLC